MKAAVLGSPIAHSLSPVLHAAGYAALGLDDWTYTAIECDEAGLPALVASCGPELGWPVADHAAQAGRAAAARHHRSGRRRGRRGQHGGVQPRPPPGLQHRRPRHGGGHDRSRSSRAVGRGGSSARGATACSALAALRDTGLRTVTVAVRDPARAASLLDVAEVLGVQVELRAIGRRDWPRRHRLTCSSPPSRPAPPTSWPKRSRRASPSRRTSSTSSTPLGPPAWPGPPRKAGATVVGGFDLLLHQAVGQFELMTGRPAPLDAMRTAGQAELDRRSAAL